MNGKRLLLEALRNHPTPRPAWVPFVGVHGGHLLGVSSTEYLKSAELLAAGLRKARELYSPDGLPVVFDLQMEAEILGCGLQWADEAPPAVTSHPLHERAVSDLPAFDATQGRYPAVRKAMETLRAEFGEDTALYGLITGPFTLASHLLGSRIFLDMLQAPESVKEALTFCASFGKACARFYCEHGADVIAVVDPMTSQISADHFVEFVTPYLNEVFLDVRHAGRISSLFVCGDATRNLEVMCRTECDNISIDENIPLELVKRFAQASNKSFGGNLRLTTVLLLGAPADAMLDAIRCIDTGGRTGFILAPGCDLPYATPPANLDAVARMVHDEYQRQVARTTVHATDMGSFDDLLLPDYENDPRVIVDVITLDSAACAPCLYMVDAARLAAAELGGAAWVREHKIKTRDGIGYMCRLGVKNIPSICIDGRVAFSSVIPDSETLTKAFRDRLQEKGRQ